MAYFFDFIHFFGFICQKKYAYFDFDHKPGIQQIKSKKYSDFRHELGELAIQIKHDYNINWKNAQIEQIFNNFP